MSVANLRDDYSSDESEVEVNEEEVDNAPKEIERAFRNLTNPWARDDSYNQWVIRRLCEELSVDETIEA